VGGMVCDVTKAVEVTDMVERVVCVLGKIDILVNSVGIVIWKPAEEMKKEEWRKVIDTNLTGAFLCCREVAKRMIPAGGGTIVNIASMSAHIVNCPQDQISYNTSKAGMIHMTRSMAAEWAEDNIRVNTVSPGYTLTEMT